MKAIIEIDVPEFQIGQEVKIYFKDTMTTTGIVQKQEPNRVNENKEIINHFLASAAENKTGTFEQITSWHLGAINSYLADISKSLAVIADKEKVTLTGRIYSPNTITAPLSDSWKKSIIYCTNKDTEE